jgi:hypothetical protein
MAQRVPVVQLHPLVQSSGAHFPLFGSHIPVGAQLSGLTVQSGAGYWHALCGHCGQPDVVVTQVPPASQSWLVAHWIVVPSVGQLIGGIGQADSGQQVPPVQHLTGPMGPQSATEWHAPVGCVAPVSLQAAT